MLAPLDDFKVKKEFPSDEEINKAADDYGFRVPYDGSNRFYDDNAINHFLAGIEFVKQYIAKTKRC